MAPHSSTLAWKISWTEEPCGLQSMGSLRVGYNWATSLSLFIFMHWRRLWCSEGVGAGGEGDNRGWDGWMASPTQWTWVWVNSWSWWWTGRPGVLRFMGSQKVGHDWATELNWTYSLRGGNIYTLPQMKYQQALWIYSPIQDKQVRCISLCKVSLGFGWSVEENLIGITLISGAIYKLLLQTTPGWRQGEARWTSKCSHVYRLSALRKIF